MKSYELTYIISSQLTADEAAALIKDVEVFIQEKEGVIIKSEKTHAQTLAYPIKKQASGYFVTTIFQATESAITTVRESLKKNKGVLRHFILIKKPAKIMKERRMRKQLFDLEAAATPKAKKTEEKVNPADLDKKIDELLG